MSPMDKVPWGPRFYLKRPMHFAIQNTQQGIRTATLRVEAVFPRESKKSVWAKRLLLGDVGLYEPDGADSPRSVDAMPHHCGDGCGL